MCPNHHQIDTEAITRFSCGVVSWAPRDATLQEYFDDYTAPLADVCCSCASNISRKFSFVTHPPLLAVDLGENKPYPNPVLTIKSGEVNRCYNPRGLIYFAADHFMARLSPRWGWFGSMMGSSLVDL